MVATAPGEKLLTPCEELDPPCDMMLVLCRKLHLFLGKARKKLLPLQLLFLTPICTPLGELAALPQAS